RVALRRPSEPAGSPHRKGDSRGTHPHRRESRFVQHAQWKPNPDAEQHVRALAGAAVSMDGAVREGQSPIRLLIAHCPKERHPRRWHSATPRMPLRTTALFANKCTVEKRNLCKSAPGRPVLPLSARRCTRAGVRRGEEQPRQDRFSPWAPKPSQRRRGGNVTVAG